MIGAGQSNEGKKLPVGTYFYHMIYDDNLQKTGWVYLKLLDYSDMYLAFTKIYTSFIKTN